MYSYIKGQLMEVLDDTIVLENNGIGYNIRIPASILPSLEGIGQELKIYTYTCVREDAFLLYGFLTRDDLHIFRQLITVNGIGPKGALAILSVLTPDELRFAILGEDEKTISQAPGIGKKTAQRLIIELKDKMDLQEAFELKTDHLAAEGTGEGSSKEEAILALVSLGYSALDARRVLQAIPDPEGKTAEELLRLSLQRLSFL